MKNKIIRIVSVFSVFLFLFVGLFAVTVSAVTVDTVTKSLLGLYRNGYFYTDFDYGGQHATEEFIETGELYPSIFLAYPYKGNGTSSFTDYYSFMPTDGISVPSVSSGDTIGVQYSLGFQGRDSILFGAASTWSNHGSFYASDDFLRIDCSFTSSIYFTNNNYKPTFYYYIYERYFDNEGIEQARRLEYSLTPDLFDMSCTKISNNYFLVEFSMYIDCSKMKTLNFDTIHFTLQRSSPTSGDWFMVCQSVSIDNISASDLPTSVPAPDTSTNDQLDSLEDELNQSVKDFANGGTQSNGNPSGGASIDESFDLSAGVNDSPFLPNTDPVFFDSPPQFQAISEFSVDPLYGMQFWSHILSALIQLPGIELLFKISLSVGLFAFLFGLIGSIMSKAERSVKAKKAERQRRKSKKSSSDGGD